MDGKMKYFVCNLKNKMNYNEAKKYSEKIKDINEENKKIIIIPSFPYLNLFNSKNYDLGSQDISAFKDIILTGEVTSYQLKSLGVKYVIVGHSERRQYKKEINIDFINKINNAQMEKLNVIYCIGETKIEKDNNKTYDVLAKQISEVLNNVELKNIIIAYEPIWAIGTGITPTKEEISDKIQYIKDIINEKYDIDIKVLYGGSINPDNIKEINSIANIDGFLIGGSSLDYNNVNNMLKQIE